MEDPNIGKSGIYVLDPESGLTMPEKDYQAKQLEITRLQSEPTNPVAEDVITSATDADITALADLDVTETANVTATKLKKGV